MYKSISILVSIVIGLLSGCQSNSFNTGQTDELVTADGENFTFYNSESLYAELHELGQEGKGEIGDPFEIMDVWRSETDDKKYLHIEVMHQKTCDEQFEIVWDGRVAESYPLQAWLLVRLNTEDCPDLDNVTTDTLLLDLYEFLGDERYLADEKVIFHLYNVSSDQSTNYDGPVSSGD